MKAGLISPWEEYYKKVDAMFKNDDDVRVVYYPEEYKIKLFVEKQAKAEVLNLLLKPEVTFGNITVLIEVMSPDIILRGADDAYKEAFRGNRAVADIKITTGVFKATYIIFKKDVVQYYDDDISSVFSVRSTLYETIAKEIFVETPGVYFCTDCVADSDVCIREYVQKLKGYNYTV